MSAEQRYMIGHETYNRLLRFLRAYGANELFSRLRQDARAIDFTEDEMAMIQARRGNHSGIEWRRKPGSWLSSTRWFDSYYCELLQPDHLEFRFKRLDPPVCADEQAHGLLTCDQEA